MKLIDKIENKTAIVGIVGLGYVGLPMAVTVAKKGFEVIGVDISDYAVNHVNAGENYIGDVDDAELKELVEKGKLKATFDYKEMEKASVIMIAVPTPLDKYQQPDSSYVRSSV
ncbi:MAG: UDP-N-acetyl-D-glucosamine dehydrogenase, partial [Candidatus Cloacimonetes bacterium]|nr:UDP-N-acetyl-D-glucosamine dehydrogenase [Candidatus Cloacimonadota bacterium]